MVTGQPDFFRSTAIQAQTMGIYLIRDWSAKKAFFKDWHVLGGVDSGGVDVTTIYTVPAEHILYINDVVCWALPSGANISPQIGFLPDGGFGFRLHNVATGAFVVRMMLTSQRASQAVNYTRAIRLDEGATLRSYANNWTVGRVGYHADIYGYEESPSTERKTYRLSEDEIFKRGLWNSCIIINKPDLTEVTLYNALTGRTLKFRGKKVGPEIRLSKTRRHKVEWWKGY